MVTSDRSDFPKTRGASSFALSGFLDFLLFTKLIRHHLQLSALSDVMSWKTTKI